MKINIARVIQPLDLGDYAESMRGQVVLVWVNPDRATLRRRELLIEEYNRKLREMNDEAQKAKSATQKAAGKIAESFREKMDDFSAYATGEFIRGIHAWFAEIWSQGSNEETQWTPDELVELNEADPALYQWMKNHTVNMISEHREREKKG